MDESSETSSAKDVPAGSLRAGLNELKRLIQSVLDGTDSPVGIWKQRRIFGVSVGARQGRVWVILDP